MKKLIKYLKEWSKDYNAAQQELNDMGMFTVYHQWGSYIHYTDHKFSTHINKHNDKQRTISK
jgi:hypothetical protein